eukprot:6491653-Amphidinium_carterae.1
MYSFRDKRKADSARAHPNPPPSVHAVRTQGDGVSQQNRHFIWCGGKLFVLHTSSSTCRIRS